MDFKEAYINLHLKFRSGNSIDVDRAVITREEWDALNDCFDMEHEWPALKELAEIIKNESTFDNAVFDKSKFE